VTDLPDPLALREKLGISRQKPLDPAREIDGTPAPQAGAPMRPHKGGVSENLAEYEPIPRILEDDESAKIDELLQGCPEASIAWLKKYILIGNESAAAKAIGYSAGMPTYWKKHHPKFAQLYSFYDAEVRARWNEIMQRRALQGFREEHYTADGTLKGYKIRQDPQFAVQLMKRIDPDWKDEQAGTQITINVIQVEE
jgi:hypothetical protein